MSARFQLLVETLDLPDGFWAHDDLGPLPPGEHTLLTLAQASTLEILGSHFSARQLYAAVDRLELQATLRGGRFLTTRSWIHDWIAGGSNWQSKNDHGSTGTKPGPRGRSYISTGAPASASLMARLSRLKDG